MTRDRLPDEMDLQNRRQFLKGAGKIGVAALAAPSLLAACGGGEEGDEAAPTEPATEPSKVIGLSDPFTTSPVVIQEAKFAEERAKQVGYTLLRDNAQGKLEVQVATIETWISQGVDAIVCLPFEQSALEPLAKRALDNGIVWVSSVSHMENETAAILFQNELSGTQLGEDAAEWINTNLGGKAKCLYLTFDAVPAGRERKETFAEIIRTRVPGAEVVAEQEAFDPPGGLKVTETVLEQHPDLNVVLGINDGGVLGAHQAFKNAEGSYNPDEVYLGAMDGPKEALEAIQECGIYRATAAFSVKEVGYSFIDVPKAILEEGSTEDFPVPTVLLKCGDPQVDEFLSYWE